MVHAACRGVDPKLFYPERGENHEGDIARRVCAVCVVQVPCLEYALEYREDMGIWGGTSERQRDRIRSEALMIRKAV